jgi:hypothetical protein
MASLKKSLNDYLKESKPKKSKGEEPNRDKALHSFFGGSDIFSSFVRSKIKTKKQPGEKDNEEASTISKESLVFLKIIAKNSIALPGMARDVNVLRQNVVKLVKLKANDKKSAATKADKFFKTEDQREAELEASRKKTATKVTVNKDKTDGKNKNAKKKPKEEDDDSGIIKWLWTKAKEISQLIFWGIITAIGAAITIGSDIADWFKQHFNPMEWIESLFKSITDGWKAITQTDIVKDTLLKGIGKLLEFITGGLFGEKELRENLKSLSDDLKPIVTFFTEMFDRVANWMSENIGWDKFTIPLSKFGFDMPLPDTLIAAAKAAGIDMPSSLSISFPDITIPGFRPFSKREKVKPTTKKSSEESTTTGSTSKTSTEPEKSTEPTVVPQSESEGTAEKTKAPSKEAPNNTIQTKEDAVKLLKVFGIEPDAKSPTGFSDAQGNPVEEPLLRSTLTQNGVDADTVIKLTKSTTPQVQSASPISNTMDIKMPSGGASVSDSSLSGGAGSGGEAASASTSSANISPTEVSEKSSEDTMTPKTSGSQLGKISGDVAEGQRLDSAPDAGTVVNSSTVNNNKGSTGSPSTKIADAYNTDFVEKYLQPSTP